MINIAILGLGFMGKKYLTAIEEIDEAQVSAIIDDSATENIENIPYFKSLDDFLCSEIKMDLVVISTPNYLHFSQAKTLLEHGYHILIEKPFCLKGSDMEVLIKIAQEKQLKIFFSTPNRFSPALAWLKKIQSENILGQSYLVQVNCFWNRDQRYYTPQSWKGKKELDGGTLYTQFFHFLDLILFTFGKAELLSSYMGTFRHQSLIEIEDTGVLTLKLATGGLVNFNFTTAVWDKNMETSMNIIAENGSVKISGQYFDEVSLCNLKNYKFSLYEITDNEYSNLQLNLKYALKKLYDTECDLEEMIYHQNLISLVENIYRNSK